jgi:AcrR family transcriptional regulator
MIAATERLLKKKGAGAPTLDAVARETGCAKGLVAYHFASKAALLAAAAEDLGRQRVGRWEAAFQSPGPEAAIRSTWELIQTESRDGSSAAWATLRVEQDRVTVQAVNQHVTDFGLQLARGVEGLLRAMSVAARVPVAELGWYLAAVVQGMETLLEAGAEPEQIQGAYAAAWLGLFSMTGSADYRR